MGGDAGGAARCVPNLPQLQPWCHLHPSLVPGVCPWSNLMAILQQRNGADTELLVFAMTLINKVSAGGGRAVPCRGVTLSPSCPSQPCPSAPAQTLAALPDQDSFYDVTDCLEQQGMETVVQQYLSSKGTDLDLKQQFVLYEVSGVMSTSISLGRVGVWGGSSAWGLTGCPHPLRRALSSWRMGWRSRHRVGARRGGRQMRDGADGVPRAAVLSPALTPSPCQGPPAPKRSPPLRTALSRASQQSKYGL